MPDAAYFRAWRAAHPEYRERQNRLRRQRRAARGRGDRSAEYRARSVQVRRQREAEQIGPLHVGHVLFDRARAIVGTRRSTLTTLVDPLHEDLLSVATLALLEGRDAVEAVKRFRASENRWRRLAAPILRDIAA